MSNLQNINFKDLFNPAKLNEFGRSLENINQKFSNADKNIKNFSENLINSISGLDSILSLFNNNIKSTFSSLVSFNTAFNLFNANLLYAVKLFKSAGDIEAKSSVSSASEQIVKTNMGGIAGENKTGDPIDDPELQNLIDLQIRLAITSRFTKNKARLGSATQLGTIITAETSPVLAGTFAIEGLRNDVVSNQFIGNQLNKKTRDGKEFNIKEELQKAGIDPEVISSVDWKELTTGLYFEQLAKSFPQIKDLSTLYSILSGANTLTSGMETANKIDKMVEDIGEKIKQKTKKNTFTQPIEMQFPSEDDRDYDILKGYAPLPTQKGVDVMKKREERRQNQEYKPADVSNFEWRLRVGGQNGNGEEEEDSEKTHARPSTRRIELVNSQKISDNDKAGGAKQTKGPSPFETFVGVFGQVQKVGGALNTIMNNLHIGANTFVGGLINGFNNALGIIQSIVEVIQALQTIGSILKLPFFAEGGHVPGVGDTDSVPAMLTPGEFVVKKSVVNKMGSGFFEWMNCGGLTNSYHNLNPYNEIYMAA